MRIVAALHPAEDVAPAEYVAVREFRDAGAAGDFLREAVERMTIAWQPHTTRAIRVTIVVGDGRGDDEQA
jgi:hypothetical protein